MQPTEDGFTCTALLTSGQTLVGSPEACGLTREECVEFLRAKSARGQKRGHDQEPASGGGGVPAEFVAVMQNMVSTLDAIQEKVGPSPETASWLGGETESRLHSESSYSGVREEEAAR